MEDRKVKANKEDVNTSVNLNDSFLYLKGLQECHFIHSIQVNFITFFGNCLLVPQDIVKVTDKVAFGMHPIPASD